MTSTRHRIPRLGLTGGMGSGKSTALAYLHECGAAVVSSDHIVHGLYDRPAIIAAIQGRYGHKVMTGAHVNRQALAEVRRRRLTAKLTDSEFERRLAQQMPEDEKIARSDFVFHNTGERKALREFVGQTGSRTRLGKPVWCGVVWCGAV